MASDPPDGMASAALLPAAAVVTCGLVIDWGGVLTGSLDGAISDWARRDGVDFVAFNDVMRQWVGHPGVEDAVAVADPNPAPEPAVSTVVDRRTGTRGPLPADDPAPFGVSVAELEQAPDAGPAGRSPVHRLERGEISAADFERELAAELAERGCPVPPEGLLTRLLAGLSELDLRMLDLVRRARAAGLRTALLSNSWGNHYPEQLRQNLFDAVVISGEVGMRKPEPEIFHYTSQRLGLATQHCVMVDDLPHNIAGAVAVGMVGVLHRTFDETLGELEAIFGLPLH
jgi:putative hydrolase of the HAD superfamily